MRFVAVAFVLALSVAAVSAQYTFCERYTGALFGAENWNNATWQRTLVNAVVMRAITGVNTQLSPTALVNVTGLINEPNNRGYFNGTLYPFIDYTTNAAALTTLVDHLDRFFMLGLQCRAGTAEQPWSIVSLRSVHSQMGINAVTEAQFVAQVAGSLISFGVPAGTGAATDDITYVAKLMEMFNRNTNALSTGYEFSICQATDCPVATAMAEFDTNAWGAWSDISVVVGTGSSAVTINQGDSVHWNLGAADTVVQTDTATGTTPTASGISSGATGGSFTWTFPTAGVYYFYNGNNNTNHATVTVLSTAVSSSSSSSSSSTGSMVSTGSMTNTSTGSMIGSSTASMSTGSMVSTGSVVSTGITGGASSLTVAASFIAIAIASAVAAIFMA